MAYHAFVTLRSLAVCALLALGCNKSAPSSSDAGETSSDVPSDIAAPPADATRTPSGLASKVVTAGNGTVHPKLGDRVSFHYTGWTPDGKMFDGDPRGHFRGPPVTVVLSDFLIKGWVEGIQLMVTGETRRFWIPPELAYKDKPDRPQTMVVYDISLGELKSPKAIATPSDLAAPPADAQKTKSGLAFKILTKGTGKDRPSPKQSVKVDVSGWTPDGKMIDESATWGYPTWVRLDNESEPMGWREGLQLMVVGEKRRFWIPPELAFKGKPDQPQGMVVYDLELVEIQK